MSQFTVDPGAPRSRTDWVTARLRADILGGAFSPNEPLRNAELSVRYDTSATPVREALQRLAAEGLVSITPQRGAQVAPLDPADLQHVYELRFILEPMCVQRSLDHAPGARLGEIADAYEKMEATTTEEDYWVWHNRFHTLMMVDCDSPWLLKFVGILLTQSERYRRMRVGPSRAQAVHEHVRILDACQRGDTSAVADLHRVQLANTLDAARRAIRAGGGAGPPEPSR